MSSTKVKLNNGLEIPVLGLGTFSYDNSPGLVMKAVKMAIDIGYRHFDCAYAYMNEKEIGEAIREKIEEGVVTREDLWITSKLWNTFHRPDLVEGALRTTLENLGLEYLDLYLIHWPLGYQEGDDIFPGGDGTINNVTYSDGAYEDTYKAMETMVAKRLTRSIGVSNFNSEQISKILLDAVIKPVTNQVECHPYLDQSKLASFCKKHDIVLTAYSPLISPGGQLHQPDVPKVLDEPEFITIAERYGKSVAQVLIRYQIQIGNLAIPKSFTENRLQENFDIFDFELSDDDINCIRSFDQKYRTCDFNKGHPYYPFKIPY